MATIERIKLNLQLEATESGVALPDSPAAPSTQSLTHSGFNVAQSFSAASVPVGDAIAFFEVTLSGGAASINLAALPHNGATIDGTGKKVQAAIFRNPAGNNPMTITDGASNGYNIFGDASGQVTIPGHASKPSAVAIFFPEGLQDIAAGDRTIDVAGTGTEVLEVGLVLG